MPDWQKRGLSTSWTTHTPSPRESPHISSCICTFPVCPYVFSLDFFDLCINHSSRFTTWARQYGDIYNLKVGSENVFVVSSATAFHELMEKNSAPMADRPPNHFADTVTNGGLNLFL